MAKRTRRKLTVDDMRAWASARSGACLSESYTHSQAKLRWRCREGHIWEATPMSIHQGRWCPVCARIRKGRIGFPVLDRSDEFEIGVLDPGWDTNTMLAQAGFFFLKDVCCKLPLSDHHITYYFRRNPDLRGLTGIHIDASSGRHVVNMAVFAKWIDALWNGVSN